MLKLVFAFLFVGFFACNCYESSQAEVSTEKQDEKITEEGVGNTSDQEYDDGLAEDYDVNDNGDEDENGEDDVSENLRGELQKEGQNCLIFIQLLNGLLHKRCVQRDKVMIKGYDCCVFSTTSGVAFTAKNDQKQREDLRYNDKRQK